jgi:hypothetical protein
MTQNQRKPGLLNFKQLQEKAHGDYFRTNFPNECGYKGSDHRLKPDHFALNLNPAIRDKAMRYFEDNDIAWRLHKNHGRSSQVCCLNFLMPLVEEPQLLSQFVANALGIASPEILPVSDNKEGLRSNWLVEFEWVGQDNYLNESRSSKPPRRGAIVTSEDAILRCRSARKAELLLIAWKYTEDDNGPIDKKRNHVRFVRYKDILFAEDGPFGRDIGLTVQDFFFHPFHQLARQMMLAKRMEKDPKHRVDRVRVLHLSPYGNTALHPVSSPSIAALGHTDSFDAISSVLDPPADGVPRFTSRTIEEVFAPILANPGTTGAAGADYLLGRYTFLNQAAVTLGGQP